MQTIIVWNWNIWFCSIHEFLMWVPLCLITQLNVWLTSKIKWPIQFFFCELGFVERLSCVKLFHLKEFDLHCSLKTKHSMWYAGYTCTCIFLSKYFSSERRTDRENRSIIDKNIMPLCFSHMLYLFLGIKVARETKRQVAVTATM